MRHLTPVFWITAAAVVAAPFWWIVPTVAQDSGSALYLIPMCVLTCIGGIWVGATSYTRAAGTARSQPIRARCWIAFRALWKGAVLGGIVAGSITWLWLRSYGVADGESLAMFTCNGVLAGGAIACLFATGLGQRPPTDN